MAQTREWWNRADARIGRLLVELGSLTEGQLSQALGEQERRERLGVKSLLGEICVEEGWCQMRDIAIAVKEQEQEAFRSSSLGQLLLVLGSISPEMLERGLERHADLAAPIGETLVELGMCTAEQVRMATQLQIFRRYSSIRRSVTSRYHPLNLMELVANYEIDDVIAEQGGCFCRRCRANVFALALNELPPRYVTDERFLLNAIDVCRAEYAERVRKQLKEAVNTVRKRPKVACRGHLHHQALERIGTVDQVVVRVSNRHIHLCAAHRDALFGAGYELNKWKALSQPGHYAAREVVTLIGEKGAIDRVRVLGPLRRETQVEISGTDQHLLGLWAPVRDSGHLEGTPGIRLRGPAGELAIERGVIRPLRHIHMTPQDAQRIGVDDTDLVDVRLHGDHATLCQGVLIRADEQMALEMHIDTDEAHAAGIPAESIGEILGPSF